MHTRVKPQKLVNSFRKRQRNNLSTLLVDLCKVFENRYGNIATMTNASLVRLKEQTKFRESERKKLQAFSDLYIDVACQIDQLPGFRCLNFPIATRPILSNLPEYICRRWAKEGVEYAAENHDTYPGINAFANSQYDREAIPATQPFQRQKHYRNHAER